MKMPIQNFSDPRVMGAACAVVGEITAMSNSVYKSVLVVITSGTYQVLLCLYMSVYYMYVRRLSMGLGMI